MTCKQPPSMESSAVNWSDAGRLSVLWIYLSPHTQNRSVLRLLQTKQASFHELSGLRLKIGFCKTFQTNEIEMTGYFSLNGDKSPVVGASVIFARPSRADV